MDLMGSNNPLDTPIDYTTQNTERTKVSPWTQSFETIREWITTGWTNWKN